MRSLLLLLVLVALSVLGALVFEMVEHMLRIRAAVLRFVE
jgi:hypothetical protein